MRISDVFPSQYVAAADLRGKDVTLEIKSVTLEQMRTHGDKMAQKPVLWFQKATKGMVLNSTNARIIAKLYGDETDGWPGKSVTIYPARVKAFGETVDAIRVREVRPAQPLRQPAPLEIEEPPEFEDAEDYSDLFEPDTEAQPDDVDFGMPTATADEVFSDAPWYVDAKALLTNGVAKFADAALGYHRDGGPASERQYGYLVGLLDGIIRDAGGGDDGHKRVLAVLCQAEIGIDNPPSKALASKLLDKLATHRMADGNKVQNPNYDKTIEDACVTIYRVAESLATPTLFDEAA